MAKMEVKTSLLDNMIGVGDMVLLEPLNEETFINNLKKRFDHNEIYVSIRWRSPVGLRPGVSWPRTGFSSPDSTFFSLFGRVQRNLFLLSQRVLGCSFGTWVILIRVNESVFRMMFTVCRVSHWVLEASESEWNTELQSWGTDIWEEL